MNENLKILKGEIGESFPQNLKNFQKQGGIWSGGNASLPKGEWTPLCMSHLCMTVSTSKNHLIALCAWKKCQARSPAHTHAQTCRHTCTNIHEHTLTVCHIIEPCLPASKLELMYMRRRAWKGTQSSKWIYYSGTEDISGTKTKQKSFNNS